MCRVLGVSRSGWYAWRSRIRPSDRELSDLELLRRIREIHAAGRGTYGSPRVHAQLKRDGVEVGKERVARLMRADGIRGRVRRRFKATTDSKHAEPVAPNVLKRGFTAQTSDSVWCADITAIWTASGWVYLAAILDLATRMIVGWSMARHMRTELVESALASALSWRRPAERLVHHSDRGSQYASRSYRDLLAGHGIECSMSRKGDCYDNAVMESFFGTYNLGGHLKSGQSWSGQNRPVGGGSRDRPSCTLLGSDPQACGLLSAPAPGSGLDHVGVV
jgi:transposase InsO family protein